MMTGETRAKRVLILTADAGFGHRSAANAIAAALQEAYGEACAVEIANPLDDKHVPVVLRNSQDDYDKLVRTAPKLFALGYELSDAVAPAAVMDAALTLMLFESLYRLVQRNEPDVIVTTYPLYQAPLKAVSVVRRRHVPLITVITDLVTIHAIWFHNATELCLVPTEEARKLALHHGIPPEKIQITGIPVHPEIAHSGDEADHLRAKLGWREDLTTALVVGSKRVGRLEDVLRALNHAGLPLQLAVVTGGDQELHQALASMTWHVPTHLYDFVTNLPEMMRAADCILCKAGGLIVSEALATGLPLLLVDVLPGQEVGNAHYVIEHGAGALAQDPIEALETLHHWLDKDGAELAVRAARARDLGRPRAAFEVAAHAWAAAERGASPRRAQSRSTERSRLISWLKRHNVAWQDDSSG